MTTAKITSATKAGALIGTAIVEASNVEKTLCAQLRDVLVTMQKASNTSPNAVQAFVDGMAKEMTGKLADNTIRTNKANVKKIATTYFCKDNHAVAESTFATSGNLSAWYRSINTALNPAKQSGTPSKPKAPKATGQSAKETEADKKDPNAIPSTNEVLETAGRVIATCLDAGMTMDDIMAKVFAQTVAVLGDEKASKEVWLKPFVKVDAKSIDTAPTTTARKRKTA